MGLWWIASVPCLSLPPAFPCVLSVGLSIHLACVALCIRASYLTPCTRARWCLARSGSNPSALFELSNLGQREAPGCELLFLSMAHGQCRQLPGTHVSTADPWCEVSHGNPQHLTGELLCQQLRVTGSSWTLPHLPLHLSLPAFNHREISSDFREKMLF